MVKAGPNITWKRYPKHRKATVKTWNNGRARKRSETAPSQYNPILFGTDEKIRELEKKCLTEGEEIRNSDHVLKAYMKTDVVVGVCSGAETNYVFAELTSAGVYHGRPISREALKKMGATKL